MNTERLSTLARVLAIALFIVYLVNLFVLSGNTPISPEASFLGYAQQFVVLLAASGLITFDLMEREYLTDSETEESV